MPELWRIVAPHYVAGLLVENDRIIEAAPILRWSVGRSWSETKAYLKSKNYHGQKL